MRYKIRNPYFLFLLLFGIGFCFGQTENERVKQNYHFAALEYSIGKTSVANVNFPTLDPQQSIMLSLGKTHHSNKQEWARQLGYPATGVVFSYADLGNSRQLGQAFSVLPFIDFKMPFSWADRLNIKIGLGASYFNTIYDELENANNKAISTHLTWAFRTNLYYTLMEREKYDIRFGLGYFHNSNGHVRLPNQGLNTFLASLYSELKFNRKTENRIADSLQTTSGRTVQRYYSARFGLGQRVLSKASTDRKAVYAFSAATGKIINKTFKYGYGFYYRFYQDYYDYITENGQLVDELHPKFKENPVLTASNLGLFANGELLLGHVGLEFEIGLNLYKPFYKVDWQINEEKYVDNEFELGELNWYYRIKKTFSSRLGTKLYLLNNNKSPRHNVFIGGFINANLGQADFTELTLGYVYALPLKKRK